MVKIVQLNDSTKNHLDFDLKEILKTIDNGDDYIWCIEYLDPIASFENGENIRTLELEIPTCPNGYILTWNELCELSLKINQVVDGIFIASKDSKNIKRYLTDLERYKNCDIVIEACDSSFWIVATQDQKIVDNIKELFVDISIETLE